MTNAATSLFYDLVKAALVDIHVVPVVRPRRPSPPPPWYDGEGHHTLRDKEQAFRRKKADQNPHNVAVFQAARRDFKKLARAKYSSYLSSVARDIGKNPTHFWSLVKARSRYHSLPSLLRSEQSGLEASDAAGKARLLMDCFQSVYLPDSDANLPDLNPVNLDAMPAVHITKSDVLSKLANIDISKATGPDNKVLSKIVVLMFFYLYYLYYYYLSILLVFFLTSPCNWQLFCCWIR